MLYRSLVALLAVAACSKAPVGLAPHQIHIAGSSAGFPFSTLVAERLMREDAAAIAPLVRAGGSGDGIARFCEGSGELYPDLVLAARTMTPGEAERCATHHVGAVAAIPIGWTGFVLVAAKGGPPLALSRAALARALSGGAREWREVDPALPPLAIRVEGPTPDPGIADGLFDRLLPPGTPVRRDGPYTGHGANAELVAAAVEARPGTLGILPYAQAVAHGDTLRMLPLDGVAPTPATIASGRYPASAPLVLLVKTAEIAGTPALPRLLGDLADALAPGGDCERRGLVPLAAPAREAAVARLRALARR